MKRPKRHKSKTQQRCEHYRKLCDMLFQHHEEYVDKSNDDRDGLVHQIESLKRELSLRKEEQATCHKIIEKAAEIDFRYCDNGFYALEVRFNGDFMGSISRYGEPREYVAQHVARQIEHQILTSRFIESAKANRRREYERVRPDWLGIRDRD